MRRMISKISIALLLFAVVGQAVASPLLACDDMSSMEVMSDGQSMTVDSLKGSSEQNITAASHNDHPKEHSESFQSIHDSCDLCVGCNSATNETVYVGYFQTTAHVVLNYLSHFASTSHDNLFRPPIYS